MFNIVCVFVCSISHKVNSDELYNDNMFPCWTVLLVSTTFEEGSRLDIPPQECISSDVTIQQREVTVAKHTSALV